MKVSDYKWNQLDEGRAYMSCHIGEGQSLVVLTTPISRETFDHHKELLDNKIKKLKQ